MTVSFGRSRIFPTAAELEAGTPPDRDRAIDVIRIAAFVALRPLENNPLPLWDGGHVGTPDTRSAAVGALLCVAGAATLASCAWGLKDQGLWCVAIILTSLVGARLLATAAQPLT
jgi:hypothetical protein